MGLGKTITTIGLILKSRVAHTLILGPLAVLQQWVKAVKDQGGAAVFLLEKELWKCQGGNIMKGRVYVANYEKLISNPSAFILTWGRIICDEAHILRNSNGKRYKELAKLTKKHIWLLTGTPIVNTKKELSGYVALFNKTVTPGVNPSLKEAKQWMVKYALCRTANQLRQTLKNNFPDEPTVVEHSIPFTTKEEETFYRTIQGKVKRTLDVMQNEAQTDIMLMLQLLLRLRQISVHPQIFINARRKQKLPFNQADWVGNSSKLDEILAILQSDAGSHDYVIFCHFQEEMLLLKRFLEQQVCVSSVQTYHGGLNNDQRKTVLQTTETAAFLNRQSGSSLLEPLVVEVGQLPPQATNLIQSFLAPPKHTVLLAQIQTAGTGLNLQHMDRAIFTTPWWTAALMDQAVARVVRLGQSRPVVIHHLTLQEEEENSINIDRYINERVKYKRSLCKELLEAANHVAVISS
jgi:SNF2 family DNA or RNA helicase